MSIMDIVRLHGNKVTPVVRPDGRISFSPDGSGLPQGMPLKAHTFHGGTDPEDAEVPAWWTEQGALDGDRAAVSTYFPGFTELAAEDGLPPTWVGTVETAAGRFKVAISHRRDHGLPSVIPLSPRRRSVSAASGMRNSPHLYDSGNLCVAAQTDWDAEVDTIATVIGWTAHWHAAYVVWRATRRWPSEGHESDAA